MKRISALSFLTHLFLLVGLIGYGLSLNAQAPSFEWAKRIGEKSTTDRVTDIKIDKYNNVYTVGTFSGTVDFDPNSPTHNLIGNSRDVYINKLDSAGNFMWAKNMGGSKDDYGYSICTDDHGSVYAIGDFSGTADFNPGSGGFQLTAAGNKGYSDIFVAKLDSAGNFVWADRIGGVEPDKGIGITYDKKGNIYITGSFQDTVDFDPGSNTSYLVSTSSFSTAFVCKLDTAGNFVWAKKLDGWSVGQSITTDNQSSVYTTGIFFNTVDFDPGSSSYNLTSADGRDVFISKLDSAGNFVWAKRIGDSNEDYGVSITTNMQGDIYTTGYFRNTVDFNPNTGTFNLTSFGGSVDVFILKLTNSGNFAWAKQLGGNSYEDVSSIYVDNKGDVYTTGRFQDSADFNPNSGTFNLTSIGHFDVFINKLDDSGNLIWAESFGGTWADEGKSIAIDDFGSVYTTGTFFRTVDFDPGAGQFNLTSAGSNDIFIQKLSQPCFNFTVSISYNSPVCYHDSLKLESSKGKNYNWTGPNGFTSTKQNPSIPNADSSLSGNYVLTMTNSNGCTDTDSVHIEVNPIPKISANTNSPICEGDTITLTSSGGNRSSWEGPNGFTSSRKNTFIYPAKINNSGNYMVSVTDSNGCSDTASVNVVVNPVPTATASSNSPICEKDSLQLNASGGSSYNWTGPNNYSSTEQNPTLASADPSVAGDYIVTVSDSSGCGDAKDTVHVTVNKYFSKNCHTKLEIPNVFTPNGDGKNDVFKIAGLSFFPGTKVLIFDRWGREVYNSNDYQNDWDGDNLKDGSYLYIITINNKDQTVYKGNLTILSSEE